MRHKEYNDFMLKHRETVWGLCMRFARGDTERAKDMVQEVWLALWLRLDMANDVNDERHQKAWVRTTARNLLIDIYRSSRIETQALAGMPTERMDDSSADMAERIEALLGALPDEERRLLQMRLEGYDGNEIADALGIERNAVYQRMSRIIAKLRKKYGNK